MLILGATTCACSKAPQSENSVNDAALLRSVIDNPGIDLWLGDESSGMEREPMIERFPLYAIHHDRYAVSGENLAKLRSKREETITALQPMIESATKAAMTLPSSETDIPTLESELTIALDLNAVELLNLLAGSAMQMHTYLRNFEEGRLETYLATSHANLHRNLLGAISGILKQEGFPPVVNEEWESEFTFDKAQGDSSLFNLLDDTSILADESTPDIPVAGLAPFNTDFSQRIIDWAKEYVEGTPTAQRKAAAGMEEPVPSLK